MKPFIVLQTLSKIYHFLNLEIFFLTVFIQDYEAANKIMETTKPVLQRHYARELKNFDLKLWNLKCVDISDILVLKIILVLVFIQFWVNNFYFSFSFSFEIILVSISVLVSVLK